MFVFLVCLMIGKCKYNLLYFVIKIGYWRLNYFCSFFFVSKFVENLFFENDIFVIIVFLFYDGGFFNWMVVLRIL